MVAVPSGIIFINDDLVPGVVDHLVRQLHITEYMSGAVFDARVAADSEYADKVRLFNLRILVIRSFKELTNRELCDLALFVKNGLVSSEFNKYGPPCTTVAISKIHWGQFGVY